MSKAHVDQLFELIKSLSKAEKRGFKIYAQRSPGKKNAKFIQLFDYLDKSKEYNESQLLHKLVGVSKSTLPNLKQHLYKQVLIALRLLHISKRTDIQVREYIDFAIILYNKGLYHQSLKILDRAKNLAKSNHLDLLHNEIIEYEKLIISNHVGSRIEDRVLDLVNEADKRSLVSQQSSQLSNLAIQMYGIYMRVGYARNPADVEEVNELFHRFTTGLDFKLMTFFEKVYYYQGLVWYNFIIQKFIPCFKYSSKWVLLFQSDRKMIQLDPISYLRGLHYVLTVLFYVGDSQRFEKYLNELRGAEQKYKIDFTAVAEDSYFIFRNLAELNQIILLGKFKESTPYLKTLAHQLDKMERQVDNYRIVLFHYKIACIYFTAGSYEEALTFLNRIIQSEVRTTRIDVHSYARLLHLICHYELSNFELLEYLVKSVYRFLARVEHMNKTVSEIFKFLRKSLHQVDFDIRKELESLLIRIEGIKKDPFEKRSLLYLDINSWIKSKIEDRPLDELVKERFQNLTDY